MNQSHDRRAHADALRRHNRKNQAARFRRQTGIMLASIAMGAVATPYIALDQQAMQAAGTYAVAKAKLWFAQGTVVAPTITISLDGKAYAVPARAVAAHPYFGNAAHSVFAYGIWGGSLGFGGWLASPAARSHRPAARARLV